MIEQLAVFALQTFSVSQNNALHFAIWMQFGLYSNLDRNFVDVSDTRMTIFLRIYLRMNDIEDWNLVRDEIAHLNAQNDIKVTLRRESLSFYFETKSVIIT